MRGKISVAIPVQIEKNGPKGRVPGVGSAEAAGFRTCGIGVGDLLHPPAKHDDVFAAIRGRALAQVVVDAGQGLVDAGRGDVDIVLGRGTAVGGVLHPGVVDARLEAGIRLPITALDPALGRVVRFRWPWSRSEMDWPPVIIVQRDWRSTLDNLAIIPVGGIRISLGLQRCQAQRGSQQQT